MRLWSVHPKYLDPSGLTAAWREGLLAKHVLEGKTKGYKNHPQLIRFKESLDPVLYINAFLTGIYQESLLRGYVYDGIKICHISADNIQNLNVTSGQIDFEVYHLRKKLESRNETFLKNLLLDIENNQIEVHPLFTVVEGEIEKWEIV